MRAVYAITASLARGLQYVLLEKLLMRMPSILFFAISSTVSFLLWWTILTIHKTPLPFKDYFKDTQTLRLLAGVTLLFLIGNVMIVYAMKGKNVTVASLIEISYPLFVVLFGYLLYRNTYLNTGTVIGGICIFAGIALVYVFNR